MPKTLPDLQRVLIANAAKRPGLRLLPVPKSLTKNAGTIAASIKSMLAAGLIKTIPAEREDVLWSSAKADERLALVVTAAGLAAIGIEDPTEIVKATARKPAMAKRPVRLTTTSPKAGTKLATLIDMLSHKDGATLAEIAKVTEWQHHSIRGAISGALKKKLALSITSDVIEDRGRAYRIEAAKKSPPVGKSQRTGRKSAATKGLDR